MIAIRSKFYGPTERRGSCVRASANGHRVGLPWDHALDSEQNHRRAVVLLCGKLGWDEDRFYGGCLEGGVWAWVPVFDADWEHRHRRNQEVK